MTAAQGEGAAPDVLRLYTHFGAFNLKTEDVIAFPSGLPGFEAVLYYGIAAPAGTPRPIIERLNKEMRAIITSDEISKRIVADGGDPVATTPEEYAANLVRGEAKWAELVKKIGLVIN